MFAQTNIISFTNASGVFITNATAIKISENKLLYRIPSGGGIVRLDSLPAYIRAEFNFNPTNAAAQDVKDKIKKDQAEKYIREQQQLFEQRTMLQSAQTAAEKIRWDEAVKLAQKHQLELIGEVTAHLGSGLLVYLYSSGTTVLVTELYAGGKIDCTAYRVGTYTYENHWDETGNEWNSYYDVWTTDINVAAQYYLRQVPTNSVHE